MIAQAAEPSWVPIVVGALAPLTSIAAALVAARSARSVRSAEISAQRIRDLENRLAGKKYEMFEPMIDLLHQLLDSSKTGEQPELRQIFNQFSRFATWAMIYGSDESVRALQRFMQTAFSEPPKAIVVRTFADFVIAARRDMSYPDSKITVELVLGMRFNDLYVDEAMFDAATLPFDRLCTKYKWRAPWTNKPTSPQSTKST